MAEEITLTGTVLLVEETKEYGAKGFKKRMMVIETDAKYQNTVPVEATQERCELFDGINKGDNVTAYLNLQGREYNGNYYASNACWRVNVNESAGSPPETGQDGGGSCDIPF